ncbi:MAG: heavy metal translocating P-type ATPase, partial [Mailhella sp.]|nr:heavy metal translocating P-type ATPase [Mailhella sp.]
MNRNHSPFGHSLEAFSPEKSVQIQGNITHTPIAPSDGLLSVQCSCGCCGHEKKDGPHEHGTEGHASRWTLALASFFALLSEGSHFAEEGGYFGTIDILGALPISFALLVIALSGVETFKAGWRSIRRLDLNMSALMSVAVTGAVLIGEFPEAAMVMVLFNVSEAIEGRVLEKARHAIKGLLALSPETALVRQPDGSWLEMESRRVPLGALVRVKPGERIALDGVVREGRSAVDQSPITGESMPVEKFPGQSVFAGTINTSGSFDFEVTAIASGTTLARIIHAVEKAQASRAPIQRFVDSFARWYTPFIFAVSLLLILLPPFFFGAEWGGSIYTGLVVLVIGCPCALVISTPVTILSGMAAATRLGMLVKGGAFLEQGRLLKVLALDKTGTLTEGRPRLTDIVPLSGRKEEAAVLLGLAASLASRSDHPVSQALATAAREAGAELAEVTAVEAVAGQGIRALCKGHSLSLGSMRMMEEGGLLTSPEGWELALRASELEGQGRTVTALA